MGLFKKIKKAVKKVAKPVIKVAKVATPVGQAQLLAKTAGLKSVATAIGTAQKIGTAAIISKVAPVAGPLAAGLANKTLGTNIPGGTMGINLGGILGAAGQALGGIQGSAPIAQALRVAGAASTIAAAAVPVKTNMPLAATPAMSVLRPATALTGTAMATVGRGFFQRFPNLATAIQKFRNAGMRQVTRPRLYGMLRRFGPELLISGGILTAAAVSELVVAGPGTRRMNPANVKALRRSVRRIESFHRLCCVTDKLSRSRPKRKKCA